jgi:2-polyprenyl-6-hydroxyphenyl methylase/3-demethylubiquinone-9 3-methyltransferase
MDEQAYFSAQKRKSEAKLAWEYGRLLRLARLDRLANHRVLDAGCGAGPGLRFFRERAKRVTGMDRSLYALQQARQRVPEARLVLGDLQAGLPFSSWEFELVILGDVLEHVATGALLLQECHRVLRPGGALLLSTVNRWDVRRFWQGQRWSGVADPTHVRLYNPFELRRALGDAGFVRVRVRAGAKPILWLPVRWPLGLPWPPLIGNGLIGAAFRAER